MGRQRILCVVTVVAALVAATPAMAQRLSLAERVTILENKANVDAQGAGNANLENQNRIVQLQTEIQSLRNVVETLQNQLEQLKESSRLQAIDADERLNALETGGAPTAATPAAPAPAQPAAPVTDEGGNDASTGTRGSDDDVAADADAGFVDAAPVDPATEEAAYQAALDTLVENFEAADSARMFQAFIRDYPESDLVPNAWYWLGESYYVTQNYELAIEAFASLLNGYPGSKKDADAMLKLGYCQLALNQLGRGEETLRALLDRHPGTESAAKAESRLRTLALEAR